MRKFADMSGIQAYFGNMYVMNADFSHNFIGNMYAWYEIKDRTGCSVYIISTWHIIIKS